MVRSVCWMARGVSWGFRGLGHGEGNLGRRFLVFLLDGLGKCGWEN